MRLILLAIVAVLTGLAAAGSGFAQAPAMHRLSSDALQVRPPSERVRGEPGRFVLQQQPCVSEPVRDLRRHIVDIAVQEWAYFGFSVQDETDPASWVRRGPGGNAGSNGADPALMRELARQRAEEAARIAPSIAGYWATTADGSWIVQRQNDAWNASGGSLSRWVQPWSAAFISWVMCEAGLGQAAAFRRAIAHHVYIDQAIRARDGSEPDAAYVAFEIGEREILPGDMLCAARRPAYRTLAQRRSQMGAGASTHCDVVVKVDEERDLLLAIGGNVRGTVGLKLLPAQRGADGLLRPLDRSSVPGARSAFAHLQLRATPIDVTAFDSAPTITALICPGDNGAPMVTVAAAEPVFERAAVSC
jgi:hypothetical protein